jgi:hypothetical protein
MAPINDSWGENGGVREVTTHSAPRSCVARATAGLDALGDRRATYMKGGLF